MIDEVPELEPMAQLFEKLEDVLFCLKDRYGRYVWANRAFLKHAKLSDLSHLAGKTASHVFPALLAEEYERQDASLIKQGKETQNRLEMITNSDGSYGWFLSDKVLIRRCDGRIRAIASMSRNLHAPAGDDKPIGRLASVISRMQQGYHEPLKISELAAEAGLTVSALERLTQSLYKRSPKQILTQLRIEAAADLLRDTNTSIASIALTCGFCDQAALSRSFRAVTGTSPLRYRNLARAHR